MSTATDERQRRLAQALQRAADAARCITPEERDEMAAQRARTRLRLLSEISEGQAKTLLSLQDARYKG